MLSSKMNYYLVANIFNIASIPKLMNKKARIMVDSQCKSMPLVLYQVVKLLSLLSLSNVTHALKLGSMSN